MKQSADGGGDAGAADRASGTVLRALALLDLLVSEPRGLALSEIARRSGLHKATAHRLLAALRRAGLVVQGPAGAYRPGLKLVRMAEQVIDALDFRVVARPAVAALARELGLGVLAGIVEGGDVVYVDHAEGSEDVRVYTRIGARRSVHLSAIGKAILAHLPAPEVEAILDACRFERKTERTIADRPAYLAELEAVRRRGWAEARDEDALGASSVAAPVFDHAGRVAGALGVAGSSFTLRDARLDAVVRRLLAVSRDVSAGLGHVAAEKAAGAPHP